MSESQDASQIARILTDNGPVASRTIDVSEGLQSIHLPQGQEIRTVQVVAAQECSEDSDMVYGIASSLQRVLMAIPAMAASQDKHEAEIKSMQRLIRDGLPEAAREAAKVEMPKVEKTIKAYCDASIALAVSKVCSEMVKDAVHPEIQGSLMKEIDQITKRMGDLEISHEDRAETDAQQDNRITALFVDFDKILKSLDDLSLQQQETSSSAGIALSRVQDHGAETKTRLAELDKYTRNALSKLSEENDEARQVAETLRSKMKSMSEKLQALSKDIGGLEIIRTKLHESEKKLLSLTQYPNLRQVVGDVAKLWGCMKETAAKVDSLDNHRKTLQEELDGPKDQDKYFDDRFEHLHELVDELSSNVKELQTAEKDHWRKLARFDSTFADRDETSTAINGLERELSSIKECFADKDTTEVAMNDIRREIVGLRGTFADRDATIKSYNYVRDWTSTETTKLREQLEAIEASYEGTERLVKAIARDVEQVMNRTSVLGQAHAPHLTTEEASKRTQALMERVQTVNDIRSQFVRREEHETRLGQTHQQFLNTRKEFLQRFSAIDKRYDSERKALLQSMSDCARERNGIRETQRLMGHAITKMEQGTLKNELEMRRNAAEAGRNFTSLRNDMKVLFNKIQQQDINNAQQIEAATDRKLDRLQKEIQRLAGNDARLEELFCEQRGVLRRFFPQPTDEGDIQMVDLDDPWAAVVDALTTRVRDALQHGIAQIEAEFLQRVDRKLREMEEDAQVRWQNVFDGMHNAGVARFQQMVDSGPQQHRQQFGTHGQHHAAPPPAAQRPLAAEPPGGGDRDASPGVQRRTRGRNARQWRTEPYPARNPVRHAPVLHTAAAADADDGFAQLCVQCAVQNCGALFPREGWGDRPWYCHSHGTADGRRPRYAGGGETA